MKSLSLAISFLLLTSSLEAADGQLTVAGSTHLAHQSGNVGIGTSNATSLVDVRNHSGQQLLRITESGQVAITTPVSGLVLPKHSSSSREALNASEGMLLYDKTLKTFMGYTSEGWVLLSGGDVVLPQVDPNHSHPTEEHSHEHTHEFLEHEHDFTHEHDFPVGDPNQTVVLGKGSKITMEGVEANAVVIEY